MKLASGDLTEQIEIFQRILKESQEGAMTFRWKAIGKVWAKIEILGQNVYAMTVRKGGPSFQHFKWHNKFWKIVHTLEPLQQDLGLKVQFKPLEDGDE